MTAGFGKRMPRTQRNSRPSSRVNFCDDPDSMNDDLSVFEQKFQPGSVTRSSKYPNIELKRCFDPTNFKLSNERVTAETKTRVGSLRSHVKTVEPRKYA